jgi:hypothetical protein
MQRPIKIFALVLITFCHFHASPVPVVGKLQHVGRVRPAEVLWKYAYITRVSKQENIGDGRKRFSMCITRQQHSPASW